METGDDQARRAHHRGVIREYLEQHFPHSDIHCQGEDSFIETFVIDRAFPPALYRLLVRFEILEDAVPDEAFVQRLDDLRIVDELESVPSGIVELDYDEDGIIVAKGKAPATFKKPYPET